MIVCVQLTCGRNMSSGEEEPGGLNRNLDGFCRELTLQASSMTGLVMRYTSELLQHGKGCGLPHHSCIRVEAFRHLWVLGLSSGQLGMVVCASVPSTWEAVSYGQLGLHSVLGRIQSYWV